MKILFYILSKVNLIKKVTTPEASSIVVINRCSCNSHCHHK